MGEFIDVWVTQKGKHVLMPEMTHGHLMNSLKWVAEKLEKSLAALASNSEQSGYFYDFAVEQIEGLKSRQAMLAREYAQRFICLAHDDCRGCIALGVECSQRQGTSQDKEKER